MRVFAKTYDAAIASREFRRQFMLTDWEETLVADDPGIRNPSPTSRLDTFIIDEDREMKLTEYNAETPAGAAYGDALTDAFIDLPVMRAFARQYEISPIPSRHGILHVLLATYEEWLGRRELPRIAIVDWPDVPTVTEFEMYRDYFHSRGIRVRHCRSADGRVSQRPAVVRRWRSGRPDLQARADPRAGRSVWTREPDGPRRARPRGVHGERLSLQDAPQEGESRRAQRRAECAPVRHTTSARPSTPTCRGRARSWNEKRSSRAAASTSSRSCAEHREQLVLKPNDDYGGAGITLGWTVDDAAWGEAIARALAAPHIVQERVRIPYEPYPSMVDGSGTCGRPDARHGAVRELR